jgi:UDP-N-acetylglucosamine 2-epimerase
MILICYGTRPEWIKVKPIIDEMKKEGLSFKTLFTGQHTNIVDNLADFNLKINDIGDNRLNNIVSEILNSESDIFINITHILIQGDTTSVLSLALNSYHRKIKIIHLEAGLRTYDFNNPFPEEMNRQLVSRITDIHLCPTELNKQNLISEKCGGQIYVVGNTVLDNIKNVNTNYGNTVLVTLHRRENHDNIKNWFQEISNIAKRYTDLKFILPIHPNPNVKKYQHILESVIVIDPLNHDELIDVLSNCRLVITDSGGIQEEGSFLNKKIIICRKITERPESIGTHGFLCDYPENLSGIFDNLINNYIVSDDCPFGDGDSSKRIIKILREL